MSDALKLNLSVETASAVGSINSFFDTFNSKSAEAQRTLRQAFKEPIQTEVILAVDDGKVTAKLKGVEDNVKKNYQSYKCFKRTIRKNAR